MNPALDHALQNQLERLALEGRDKGPERPIRAFLPPEGKRGHRYLLEGSEQTFIKMNSNDYLGLATHPALMVAAEEACRTYGVGPGAVRFISGTQAVHTRLEQVLAKFHSREDCIIFNSAYAAVVSTISSLITPDTAILSDELNHNCIINGIKLSRPKYRAVYKHLDLEDVREKLAAIPEACNRLVLITDGIFSMRGTHAPLKQLRECLNNYSERFLEGAVLIVDDSHGVGAFGATGRGTEEATDCKADILIGTLGKAFGVNGGYVVGTGILTQFLREMSPMYIYSNPIGAAEAAAATKALELVQTPEGQARLSNLYRRAKQFEKGLDDLGLETLSGEHPVTPLMVRDTARTSDIVNYLFDKGVLATGIVFPVVPVGDESIRFQLNANLTEQDVDDVLEVLASYAA